MNLQDLLIKMKQLDEDDTTPYAPEAPPEAAPAPDATVDECGDMPLPGAIMHSPTAQQDNVTMNVSMNGSGSGGIADLMKILRNIEDSAGDDEEDAIIIGEPHRTHGDHAEPIMGNEENQSDSSPFTNAPDEFDEVFDDDKEVWGNSVRGDAGHHTHGIDSVTFSGDDMNSKGKISPMARAPGTNPLRSPSQYDESLVNRLSAMYQEIKEANGKTMSRAAKGNEKYGKDGMQALAKAGREGKDLDKVRDRYNKYDEAVAEGAGEMPVNKYIARELDTLLKLLQDRVDDITNRSRDGYGNKESSGLEDVIFEISGLSNGFHSSMSEGIAELQELSIGLPRIGNWIMRNLKKVGNRIDLLQMIKQGLDMREGSDDEAVSEGFMDEALDKENRASLRNRIAADALNFYSRNDRIPKTSELSHSVKSELNSLEFDERSELYRQGVVQALKLHGKQRESNMDEGEGMSRAAKGYEKYGREGMAALAKAGREGKSLEPIKAKFNKYDESISQVLALNKRLNG